jgi:hypothetical protein
MPDFGIFRGFNDKLFGDKLYAGQLPINLGLIGSTDFTGIDPDYQAILDYANTKGYTLPSNSQQLLQNDLVKDLKAAGIWDKLDTFSVFATDGDSDFALIDWIRLTDYTAVNSPTFFTNLGFKGFGSSAYINTNYTPSTQGINYTSSDASFGVFWDKNSATTGYLLGSRTGADANANFLNAAGLNINSINSNSTANRDVFRQNYDFKQVQLNSGTQYLFGDGVQDDTFSFQGSPSSPIIPIFLLCFNNNGSPAIFSDGLIRSFYAGSSLLSESSDFNNALTTYYNAL